MAGANWKQVHSVVSIHHEHSVFTCTSAVQFQHPRSFRSLITRRWAEISQLMIKQTFTNRHFSAALVSSHRSGDKTAGLQVLININYFIEWKDISCEIQGIGIEHTSIAQKYDITHHLHIALLNTAIKCSGKFFKKFIFALSIYRVLITS